LLYEEFKEKNKKKEIINPLNQKAEHWKPNYFHCRYFEKYKKLHEEHEMNNWEIVNKKININIIKIFYS
jgi:hypothetical protein